MVRRVGWGLYATGLAAIAAGLFAFPWLSAGSHGCYAVAGGGCAIANGNTTTALILFVGAVCLGVWRARQRIMSLAVGIGLAASAIGIGFSVLAFNYDSFTAPAQVFTSPPTHAQLQALLWTGNLAPSTGFALTLLGAGLLVASALVWSFGDVEEASTPSRTRAVVGCLGVASALIAALGAWLPWVHVSPASAVLDTDHTTVGAAATVLLVAAASKQIAGGRGWTTAFAVSAGLLCTVAVYQWLELRWEQTDMQMSGAAHVVLASGTWVSLFGGILAGGAAVAVFVVEPPRRSRASAALTGGFVALLLCGGLVSYAVVNARPHSCDSGVLGVRNGQPFSQCLSTLYEPSP